MSRRCDYAACDTTKGLVRADGWLFCPKHLAEHHVVMGIPGTLNRTCRRCSVTFAVPAVRGRPLSRCPPCAQRKAA